MTADKEIQKINPR